MATADQTRRGFLVTLIAALAGAAALGRYLSPTLRRKKALLKVAKADLPVQGALVYRAERVALMREGERVYALSLICTHLGCTVNVTPGDIVCPCHGSSFDRDGRVLKGPADLPLRRLAVEEQGEFFHVLV
ncbi:cytochrome b6 [Geomonas silvestris]|uniref:Cytochrome b6 n=1 Tax=Geomonas silvestris TaxID=2740184 RepID=A0A6V8MPD9_9BACT|nr:Rieske (2Fe-2S) protein [Geomonas silvestris]GFO61918.1 cytochrome b6 [Geomonas silvestris]